MLANAHHEQDTRFGRAFDILEAAVADRAFPGASLSVVHRGKLMALKGIGRFTYDATSTPVTADTIYDLASLTKVLCTATMCMLLLEQGKFDPEMRVVDIVPEFASEDSRRNNITLGHLLSHSSGLPAYVRLYQQARDAAHLMQLASQVPLKASGGTQAEYSDVGFIILGVALERLARESLGEFFQREIARPLGLARTRFCPPDGWKRLIPPTLDDREFRHRTVEGEVNDENAWVMGGIAAHAGLFGSARDLGRFAACMLEHGRPIIHHPETLERFTRRETSPRGTSRTLGWDPPAPPSQSGRYFGKRAFGHLGYTGTSLWIDPERKLAISLLTNRTWPDRYNDKVKKIRPAFHDAIVEALA
jgi:CubicO group peptidase (beta-lactamase class C family)